VLGRRIHITYQKTNPKDIWPLPNTKVADYWLTKASKIESSDDFLSCLLPKKLRQYYANLGYMHFSSTIVQNFY
jgi:hypothetical protein